MLTIPGMITRSQAAKRLGCGRSTIDRLIGAGRLRVAFPYPGNTRHLLVSVCSVDAYIAQMRDQAEDVTAGEERADTKARRQPPLGGKSTRHLIRDEAHRQAQAHASAALRGFQP